MKKKILLVAGIAGMLLGMPHSNAQAEYRVDRIEERGPRRDHEYRRHDRERFERRRFEREERRRLWREEERRRRHDFERHRHEHRHDRRY